MLKECTDDIDLSWEQFDDWLHPYTDRPHDQAHNLVRAKFN
jgi:hypothetical protein